MKIKNGFNSKETQICITTQSNGSIELWIEQQGLGEKETLSYLTLDELYELRARENRVRPARREY